MKTFEEFTQTIADPVQRDRVEAILNHIREKYPELKEEVKWSQPMFSDHGTFIIGFSLAKAHLAVAPEAAGVSHFEERITAAGYSHTRELYRIRWGQAIDLDLIDDIIDYNRREKQGMTRFWRAPQPVE